MWSSVPESPLEDGTPGLQHGDVYERLLPWWRARIRQKLVESIEVESRVIAKVQSKIRAPWLDAYFVYTSSLGTHTFFMIILPAFFFFGYGEFGRSLLAVLAFGIYLSSVIKDLICSPRPFAPPVTRLTISSHHLEYGLPSTHSTNSVSIALFFYAIFYRFASAPANSSAIPHHQHSAADGLLQPAISSGLYLVLCSILVFYTFSIVFGRLYTGMHSFTDCFVGALLGAGTWWVQTDWPGVPLVIDHSNPLYQLIFALSIKNIDPNATARTLYLGRGLNMGAWAEGWVRRGGWEVPLILIPLCLLAVHKHPQPVDDCPCFEDAIAILSVCLGAYLSQWAINFAGGGALLQRRMSSVVVMPGSGWAFEAGRWLRVERGWQDVVVWWTVAAVKMVLGILTIFAWRIFAKSALHLVLPPTFRLLSQFFRLPRRRFYTPATEYESLPSEFHSQSTGAFGLHPIPSVIDLPSRVAEEEEEDHVGWNGNQLTKKTTTTTRHGSAFRDGGVAKTEDAPVLVDDDRESRRRGRGRNKQVKHYDVDVLTKVIVYAGIAILSSAVIPLMFDLLGLGVKSWVEV